MGRKPTNEVSRFWSHVRPEPGDACWVWTAHRNKAGYGRFQLRRGGRPVPETAHRYSYRLHYGEIPTGMFVCHRCDNPPCVNPAHLFAGTARDNSMDARAKGRLCIGERQRKAKLTDVAAVEVRKLAAAGMNYNQISKLYGVSGICVSLAVRRKTWKHVP